MKKQKNEFPYRYCKNDIGDVFFFFQKIKLNVKTNMDRDTLTSFFLALVLLTLRFLLLMPVLSTRPFLPLVDVFVRFTFLRFPVQ